MNNKQMTLTGSTGFEKYTKTTRRAVFLAEMDRAVPWAELCELIRPVYPKAGDGRPPIELELMLRVYFLQQWFNLSDPAVEEALYDSASMRAFAGVDLGKQAAPDESTVCRFRHLLGEHLGEEAALLEVFGADNDTVGGSGRERETEQQARDGPGSHSSSSRT